MIDTNTPFLPIAVAVAAGVGGGIIAKLLGVGGVIVTVAALLLALLATDMAEGIEMQVAAATSLATIVFAAGSSSRAHNRREAVDHALLRRWSPWVIGGVVAGPLLGAVVDGRVMVAVLASVATLVALNMLLGRSIPKPELRQPTSAVWAASGIAAGGISALMGIGGGTDCVPMLSYLGYDIRRAVDTSSALGLVIGITATLVYIVTGLGFDVLPPLSLGYFTLLTVGVITPLTMYFATVRARIAHAIPMRALPVCFGAVSDRNRTAQVHRPGPKIRTRKR